MSARTSVARSTRGYIDTQVSWYDSSMNQRANQAVRFLDVDAEQAGQRIDNFLQRHLKGVPKSHIYRILRRGEVRVNRGRIRPNYRLQSGDQVRIPPIRQAESTPANPRQADLQAIDQATIYEDSRLLVLNKPAGLAVHGGSGLRYGVIEALRASRPTAPFLELVHRLDRETSGCLMIAKRRSELRALHELLRTGNVEKKYLTLVSGTWPADQREVDVPLRKNRLQSGERMVRVDAQGKAARTRFSTLTQYPQASLLEVELDTGRTHQIRVHAAHVGHPLAGDEKYGQALFNRRMRGFGLRRLFLHAHSLAFSFPDTGREIHVSAPLSDDLRQVLDQLEDVATADR